MKRIVSLFAVLVLAVLAAGAQVRQEVNKVPPYFTDPVESGRAYADSQTDTLGGGFAINSAPRKIGGVNLASVVITVTDTCAADVYVDKRIRGTASWVNIVTDSLITTSATGTRKEFPLRTAATDNLACIDCETRIRIAHRASGNGVAGTATRSTEYNWKP